LAYFEGKRILLSGAKPSKLLVHEEQFQQFISVVLLQPVFWWCFHITLQ